MLKIKGNHPKKLKGEFVLLTNVYEIKAWNYKKYELCNLKV